MAIGVAVLGERCVVIPSGEAARNLLSPGVSMLQTRSRFLALLGMTTNRFVSYRLRVRVTLWRYHIAVRFRKVLAAAARRIVNPCPSVTFLGIDAPTRPRYSGVIPNT